MTMTLAAYSPGAKTTDADGMETTAWTPRGVTPGKLASQSRRAAYGRAHSETVGGVTRPVLEGGLAIPISSPLPSVGWEYQVTATGDADPALLGRRFHVTSVPAKSFATARRLDVVEVPGL